ncbi:PREDICTED: migration and invasion-inhibitory protein isoform X4 [Dipodomys ordii]|uniref:Migration and invasion-inhibitory protein isoform X4 n=1 Tax=Dipodomys ordii TaxID=10020 RepID=A0A1S3GEF4_DIPOR|nr:PREDICTED: migration and invasion-inhibitory protein isoform X4 [Dipodomys ordii]
MPRLELGAVPGLGETKDLEQLRLLNLELLKQLWIGQEAVQRSVAKAFAKSGLDCPRRYNSEIPMYPDTSLASPSTSGSRDRGQEKDTEDALGDDPHKRAWLGRASSRAASLPPAKYQRPESLDVPRFRSASLPVPREWKEPAPLAGPGDLELPKAQTPRSRRSKPFKPTVTFGQGTAVPERSWRLRPYLGYDWIAGSLDSASHITDEPEAFFSTLQKFREANKEECIHGYTEGQSQGLHGDGAEDDHQCVYCYRLNRRLFPVPVDPGAPCRLCGTPRDQRSPETLREPAQGERPAVHPGPPAPVPHPPAEKL